MINTSRRSIIPLHLSFDGVKKSRPTYRATRAAASAERITSARGRVAFRHRHLDRLTRLQPRVPLEPVRHRRGREVPAALCSREHVGEGVAAAGGHDAEARLADGGTLRAR